MLLYVYVFDLLLISTSHTAVVPKRSFSMRELKIFRSCSASDLPAGTAAAAAAVFGAEGWPEFLDIVYSAPPTATAAITTKIPTTILFEPACFCSCAASNIFPSFSLRLHVPLPGLRWSRALARNATKVRTEGLLGSGNEG